jgi:hypothetical protein
LNFTIFHLGRLQWLILREIYKVKSPKVIVVEVDASYPFGHELFKDVASTDAILSALPMWILDQVATAYDGNILIKIDTQGSSAR